MKYNAYSSTAYNSETSGIYANPRTIRAEIVVNNQYEQPYTQENIKTFKIDSTPVNGKWFGISYSQQLSVTFVDPNKNITINRGDTVQVSLVCNNVWVYYPLYYVDSSNRDEKTGDLTVIGFDIMAKANNRTFTLPDGWSGDYDDLCHKCSALLGASGYAIVGNPSALPSQTWTKETINIPSDGYSLRDMITAVSEAGGRFAYINSQNKLIFRMVTNNAASEVDDNANFVNAPVKIDKSRYFELTTDKQCVLTGITHKNELNDIVSVGTSVGINQVLYDNPLMSGLQDDPEGTPGGKTRDQKIEAILDNILNNIYTTVTPFTLNWRGNMACEIGDTVWVAEKECTAPASSWVYGSTLGVTWDCFYLSETVEYNGGVRGTVQWEYQPEETAVVGPTSVATSVRTTKAVVDKANGRITLAVETANQALSEVTIAEGQIQSVVSAMGPTGSYTSYITQRAESIASTVAEQAAGEAVDEYLGPSGTAWTTIEQTAHDVAITATEEAMVEVIGPTGAWAGEIPFLGPSGTITAMQNDISNLQIGATGITSTVQSVITAMGPTGSWGTVFGPTGTVEANASYALTQSSQAIQTANGFENRVSRLETAVGPTGSSGNVYSSVIKQTATDIKAEVYGPTGTRAIFNMVNSTSGGSAIKLKADHLDFTGQATFLTASDVGPTGSTAIDGGRITTGTISADRIDTNNLYVKHIGSVTSTGLTVRSDANFGIVYPYQLLIEGYNASIDSSQASYIVGNKNYLKDIEYLEIAGPFKSLGTAHICLAQNNKVYIPSALVLSNIEGSYSDTYDTVDPAQHSFYLPPVEGQIYFKI